MKKSPLELRLTAALIFILSISTPAISALDIKVTKTVSATTPNEGDTITYVIRIQNVGTGSVSGFSIIDTLPPELTYLSSVSSIAAASYNSGGAPWRWTISITGLQLSVGAAESLLVMARVNSGTGGGTITNKAFKSPGDGSNQRANDTSQVSVQVNSLVPAIVSINPPNITKYQNSNVTIVGSNFVQGSTQMDFGAGIVVSSMQVAAQDTINATLYASSSASSGTHDVRVTNLPPGGGADTLVGGLNVDNPLPLTSTISPSSKYVQDPTFTDTVKGTKFVQGATVLVNNANGSTGFIDSTRLTVTVPASALSAAGYVVLKVLNPAPGGGLSTTAESLQVKPSADLSVRKYLGRAILDTITYQLTVKNNGPNDATAARVTDVLPPQLRFAFASGQGTYNNFSHLWDIGNVNAGDSTTLTLVTTLTGSIGNGTLTNKATNLTASEYDRVIANNSDSVSILLRLMRPGDTNDNDTVNASDIIGIGLCYGITGPPRAAAADTLQQYLPLGWNTPASPDVCAYADCSGDGRVDTGDVWTIIKNWGRRNWTGEIQPGIEPLRASRHDIIQQLITSVRQLPAGIARTEMLAMLEGRLAEEEGALPKEWSVQQNYPNPFNGETTIRYSVPGDASSVRVAIYDIIGKRIKLFERGFVGPGDYEFRWVGTSDAGAPVASGVYFYRIELPVVTPFMKIIYLR